MGVLCAIGAPLAFAAAWWVLALDPGGEPTAASRVAHLLLLLGLALMLGVASLLHTVAHDAGGRLAGPAFGVVLVGALGLAGNFALDLAAERIAQSQADLDRFFSAVTADPLIGALFYTVLPFAFYVGLAVQVFVVRADPAIPRWAPVPVALGIAILGVERAVQIPALAVVAHAAMIPGFTAVALRRHPAAHAARRSDR